MKNRPLSTSISTLLAASILLLGTRPASADDDHWITNATGASWSVGANWDDTVPPSVGDNVFFNGPAPAVLLNTATTSVNVDVSPILGTLNVNKLGVSNLTLTGVGAQTLTLNSGITTDLGANLTISAGSGANTLGVVLGGNNAWALAGTAGSPTVSSVISDGGNNFSITKTGNRTLTLSGSNTFGGGIIHRQGTVQIGGVVAATVLGTGTFTRGNLTGGTGNTLALNGNLSKTIANNFVNDNAAVVTGTEYAQFSYFGATTSYQTTTFDGSFSTGPNFLFATQAILLGANGTTNGLAEGTLVFNGSWAGYAGNDGNANSIRINGGSTVLNAQQAVAAGGTYNMAGNDLSVASKLILNGAFTNAREVRFSGTLGGQRNSYGSRNSASTTAIHSGNIQTLDAKGGNIFSQNAGAILEVSGNLQGSTNLRVNDSYTFTNPTGNVNSLQTPAGTVIASRAIGNSSTGGVTVVGGTFLVNNTSNSGTGTGAIQVGVTSGTISGLGGAAVAGTRVITGMNTAAVIAGALEVGQTITGTGIPGGTSIITGIAIGTAAADTEIVIAGTIAGVTTFTDLATPSALTKTGVLGGTGRIAPTGANGLTVLSGSSIGLVDASTNDLDIEFVGTGVATFASGAKFALELNASGVSDVIDFAGLADASTVTFNNNVIDFTNLGGLAAGNLYTLFTFDTASKYTGTLVVGAGLGAFGGGSLIYNASDIQLLVVPEPGAAISLLGGLGVLLGLRRRTRA